MTEEQRKRNSKFMILYMSIIAGVIGAYIGAYIAGLVSQYGVDIGTAFKMFPSQLAEFKLIPPICFASLSGIIIGGALFSGVSYFALKVDYDRNYTYKLDEIAGTGGFMTENDFKEYEKKYIEPEPSDPNQPSPNMILGNRMRRPNNSRKMIGNNNIAVVGGAGSGKSRFLIKPNLLTMNSSFVVTDPSGEIINSLGKILVEHGFKIKVFNISDMQHSNCYNPLKYIRNEAGVRMVIDCLINNTTDKNAKGGDQFWVNTERLLYSACIFYLLNHCHDKSKRNFASIAKMINMSMVDENNLNAQSPLDRIFETVPKDSLAWQYYKGFKQGAGKTMKSIVISCIARLQPFLTPQVVNLTKMDELELEKIGDEKTVLFIITPQADHTYDFLPSMLYSQLFETLYHKGEQQKAAGGSEAMKIPVRCLMDEFANIGTIPDFPSKLATMRKYNISATIMLQDISQIEAMYEDEWRTIMGNCSTYIFLGTQEPNTLKYFSEMLGKTTITARSRGMNRGGKTGGGSSRNFQQTGREVMTSDELARMSASKEIIFIQNQRPMLDDKYKYEQHPLYKLTGDGDKSRVFLYNQMPAYDNTRPMNIYSLLRAKAEASRITSKAEVTDPDKIESRRLAGGIDEAYNRLLLDRKTEAKAFDKALNEGIELAMSEPVGTPACIKLTGVQSKKLPEMVKQISAITQKRPLVIFTDLGGDEMLGAAVADNVTNIKNDYTLATDRVADNEDIYLLAIKSRVYQMYKDEFQKLAS